MSDNDYKRLDDSEIVGGTFGQPIRNSKLVNTKKLKAKLNSHVEKALSIITGAMEDEKKAYAAAKDVLAFYVQLANLDMKEELHQQDLLFRKHKNNNFQYENEREEAERKIAGAGGTADVPESKFSMDYEEPTSPTTS